VSAAYCRDLGEFLQQFDTDPLSFGFRVAGSCEPVDYGIRDDRAGQMLSASPTPQSAGLGRETKR
jgi:hypothetical protein